MNWFFRNRQTGRITVFQRPNAALAIWLVATLLGVVLDATGRFATVLTVIGTAALIIWAGDELLRGVNPFRRVLGGAILVLQLTTLAARAS